MNEKHYFDDGTTVPSILTPEDVCRFLRIPGKITRAKAARTLDYYRSKGLRSFRIGKEIRYRIEDVVEFVNARREQEDFQ